VGWMEKGEFIGDWDDVDMDWCGHMMLLLLVCLKVIMQFIIVLDFGSINLHSGLV